MAKKKWLHKILAILPSISLIVILLISSFEIGAYGDWNFYEKEYVNPAKVKMTFPKEKKNLIYIFMESMESSYADKEDGGTMDDNYIPNLTKLAKENINFSRAVF